MSQAVLHVAQRLPVGMEPINQRDVNLVVCESTDLGFKKRITRHGENTLFHTSQSLVDPSSKTVQKTRGRVRLYGKFPFRFDAM
jgi:hypothetical protein